MNGKRLVVAHSVEAWLPRTNNWIFHQIRHMNQVASMVLARQLVEPNQFPWRHVFAPGMVQRICLKAVVRVDRRWHPSQYHAAIRRHGPALLHSHFGNVGWFDMPLASKHGLKHIVTFYGADMSLLPAREPSWRERYQDLFSAADLFLCEGPHMARQLVALGCPEGKVQVQRLGVPLEEIDYVPRQFAEEDTLKVLVAGTFREKKGIPFALEAIGRLHQAGVNLAVTVIGDSRGFATDELEKKKILDVIEQYDMLPITRLLGYQTHDEMMAEAYRHHVFLSPSVTGSDGDTEGGAPVVIIEMAASGMPVISTKHCDIPQVILDGRTGWLADERDVEGLMHHLQWLVANPEKWQASTDLGRKHIEANFDVRRQAESLGAIYQELAGNR